MLRVSPLAKNYAKALFDLGLKSNALDKISSEVEIFNKNFSTSFARELKNPAISKADSVKIINGITQKLGFSKTSSDFFAVISENKRLALFPEIYAEFNSLLKLKNNILDVELISSTKLDNATVESIKAIVGKKYAGKKIEVKEVIKQEILGGLQIKIGSDLFDASLKNQIASLERELLKAIN